MVEIYTSSISILYLEIGEHYYWMAFFMVTDKFPPPITTFYFKFTNLASKNSQKKRNTC